MPVNATLVSRLGLYGGPRPPQSFIAKAGAVAIRINVSVTTLENRYNAATVTLEGRYNLSNVTTEERYNIGTTEYVNESEVN